MKPYGKQYYSIGHLYGSKVGTADRNIDLPKNDYLIGKKRLKCKKDLVIVTEKYDGSNTTILRKGYELICIQRNGYLCCDAPFLHLQYFVNFVNKYALKFLLLLKDGERCVCEWLLQRHGTIYDIKNEIDLLVVLGIFDSQNKENHYFQMKEKVEQVGLHPPRLLYCEHSGVDFADLEAELNKGSVFAKCVGGFPEGAVWQMEHKGEVRYRAKYVRQGFDAGRYLENDNFNYSSFKW